MEQKSIYKNPRTKRCIRKTEMDEEQEEDKGTTITFGKINIFTFPRFYPVKNRFQICRKKQHGDPRRRRTPRPGQASNMCAVVGSLADGFVVMKSEDEQSKALAVWRANGATSVKDQSKYHSHSLLKYTIS